MKFFLFLSFIILSIDAACMRTKQFECCNDHEMLEQCEHTQSLINDYCNEIIALNNTLELKKLIPQLNCDQYALCCVPKDRSYYLCQNMISYDKCLSAKSLLSDFIINAEKYVVIPQKNIDNVPTFTCKKKSSVIGYGVYDYYESNSSQTGINYFLIFGMLLMIALFR
jgi:hypothetical protein